MSSSELLQEAYERLDEDERAAFRQCFMERAAAILPKDVFSQLVAESFYLGGIHDRQTMAR